MVQHTVPFTSASEALVLLMLAEMWSVAPTEVSRMNHRVEEMWLQKPLLCVRGAGQPVATGEAAAEQHGVCATQLPRLKTDT